MATPTPIAAYRRDAKTSEAVRKELLPDSDVVHACLDLPSAEVELPAVCAGDLTKPVSSGLGSNADWTSEERRVPKLVLFGGGTPDEEAERIAGLVRERAPDIRFVRITRADVLAAGATGPDPGVIARIFRDKVAAS